MAGLIELPKALFNILNMAIFRSIYCELSQLQNAVTCGRERREGSGFMETTTQYMPRTTLRSVAGDVPLYNIQTIEMNY